MKRGLCCVLAIAVLLSLSGCFYKSWFGKRPCDQPNSEWISEDQSITFSIGESGSGIGKITTDDGTIDIHIGIGPATEIAIYPLENVTDNVVHGEPIERWLGSFRKEDTFTATVKETTYFSVDQEIKFTRVDRGTSE